MMVAWPNQPIGARRSRFRSWSCKCEHRKYCWAQPNKMKLFVNCGLVNWHEYQNLSLVLDLSLLHGHEKAVLLVVISAVWQLIRIRAKLNAVHVGVGYAGQHVLHRYHARWVAASSVRRLKEHMIQHESTSFWKLHCLKRSHVSFHHLNFNETWGQREGRRKLVGV